MIRKKGWLASLLSFLVPGLGHIYGREVAKGIIFYVLFYVILFSLRFVAYNFVLFAGIMIVVASYFLYLVISAYHVIQKGKEYAPVGWDKWYVYFAIWVVHIFIPATINGRTLDRLTPINFASIPTPSMSPTLHVGDILAHDKTGAITRNDLAVFRFPNDLSTLYIMRSVGLPGDSLEVEKATVYVNGNPLKNIPALNYRHLISTNGSLINPRIFEELAINDFYQIPSGDYVANITIEQAKKLEKVERVAKLELAMANYGEGNPMIFPEFHQDEWNADYYGPIYIPKKGDRIILNHSNAGLYAKCIAFENELVELKDSGIFIEGERIDSYEFKNNYYFTMGDNRHNSLDSRYWGFLPEQLVVGKVLYIFWGETFDRIGKEFK